MNGDQYLDNVLNSTPPGYRTRSRQRERESSVDVEEEHLVIYDRRLGRKREREKEIDF